MTANVFLRFEPTSGRDYHIFQPMPLDLLGDMFLRGWDARYRDPRVQHADGMGPRTPPNSPLTGRQVQHFPRPQPTHSVNGIPSLFPPHNRPIFLPDDVDFPGKPRIPTQIIQRPPALRTASGRLLEDALRVPFTNRANCDLKIIENVPRITRSTPHLQTTTMATGGASIELIPPSPQVVPASPISDPLVQLRILTNRINVLERYRNELRQEQIALVDRVDELEETNKSNSQEVSEAVHDLERMDTRLEKLKVRMLDECGELADRVDGLSHQEERFLEEAVNHVLKKKNEDLDDSVRIRVALDAIATADAVQSLLRLGQTLPPREESEDVSMKTEDGPLNIPEPALRRSKRRRFNGPSLPLPRIPRHNLPTPPPSVTVLA